MQKLTLYEVLHISPNASADEIKQAYLSQKKAIETSELGPTHEFSVTKLKVLQQAYDTLSVAVLRDAYDAKLRKSTVDIDASPADEIMAIKTRLDTTIPELSKMSFKFVMIIMVIFWVGNLALSARSHMQIQEQFKAEQEMTQIATQEQTANDEIAEKLYLQQFYERTGYRAASRTEAQLIEAKLQEAKQEEQRKKYEDERLQRERDEARRQFHYEGEQVSRQLNEDFARQQRLVEQEKMQTAQAERIKKDEERRKIESQKYQWKNILYGHAY